MIDNNDSGFMEDYEDADFYQSYYLNIQYTFMQGSNLLYRSFIDSKNPKSIFHYKYFVSQEEKLLKLLGQPTIDKDKIVQKLDKNAIGTDTYHGNCAAKCREALAAGGLNDPNHPYEAKDYGPWLAKHGAAVAGHSNATTLPTSYTPQAGDVAVFEGGQRHTHGHLQIYDGKQWVSDTRQSGFSPNRNYEGGVTIYRFPN
jgi:hypothetical protein